MNNKEVKNVENKQNNSLMRKTKVQLVEIILRKDSIEKNLRNDITSLRDDITSTKAELNKAKTEINIAQSVYSKLNSDYSELKSDYIDMCDEKVSVECKFRSSINKQRGVIWFLAIMFVISVAVNIALYLM